MNFKIIKSKKFDKNLIELRKLYEDKIVPTMPIGADVLMTKYNIPSGEKLGKNLKKLRKNG